MADEIEVPETSTDCDFGDVGCYTTAFGEWLTDVLLWWPRKMFELFLDGAAMIINAIPLPDAFTDIGSYTGAFSGTAYYLHMFAVSEGVGIVLGALLARFIVRRIPLIG